MCKFCHAAAGFISAHDLQAELGIGADVSELISKADKCDSPLCAAVPLDHLLRYVLCINRYPVNSNTFACPNMSGHVLADRFVSHQHQKLFLPSLQNADTGL